MPLKIETSAAEPARCRRIKYRGKITPVLQAVKDAKAAEHALNIYTAETVADTALADLGALVEAHRLRRLVQSRAARIMGLPAR